MSCTGIMLLTERERHVEEDGILIIVSHIFLLGPEWWESRPSCGGCKYHHNRGKDIQTTVPSCSHPFTLFFHTHIMCLVNINFTGVSSSNNLIYSHIFMLCGHFIVEKGICRWCVHVQLQSFLCDDGNAPAKGHHRESTNAPHDHFHLSTVNRETFSNKTWAYGKIV